MNNEDIKSPSDINYVTCISGKDIKKAFKTNIILLDIDDTILPTSRTWLGEFEDNLETLTINCKRLSRMCKLWDLQIRIISSWSNGSLDYIDNDLKYVNKPIKDYYIFEKKAFDIIYKYLNEYITGISSGNKEKDIKNAVHDRSIDNVFVLDDTDHSASCNSRNHSYYIKSEGYISNHMIYRIGEILNKIP